MWDVRKNRGNAEKIKWKWKEEDEIPKDKKNEVTIGLKEKNENHKKGIIENRNYMM